MAGIKQRGILTNHLKKYYNDQEVVPAMWIRGSKKGVMVAQYRESGDLALDKNGKPILYRSV
jgi:hypothetical protein